MGVSPQTLQDILQRGRPRPETAERLAAALDMSVDDLLAEVKAAEYGAVFLPQMI
jgi:transcriptional regulator with XRE-family HTH domain